MFIEYETGAIEGVEEEDIEEESDPEPIKRGRGRPPKGTVTPKAIPPGVMTATKNTMHSLLASMGYPSKCQGYMCYI